MVRRYIAAAYRGELRSALRRRVDKTLPHEIASDLAEQAVAAAAQISDRQVKKLYFEDGDKFSRIKPSEEETSAAKLKRHLEKGHPDLPPI